MILLEIPDEDGQMKMLTIHFSFDGVNDYMQIGKSSLRKHLSK